MARILIVEDNPDMQQIYKDLLVDKYELIVVGRASHAEKYIKENNIDLMILDIILPDEHGDVFLERMRKSPRFKKMKVIVVTVLGDISEQMKAMHEELVCLPKPFNHQKLLETIRKMVR